MDTYYVGTYGDVPIAVDKHRENVKYYLKNIRKIPSKHYTIRPQKMTDGTAYSFFEREIMDTYDEGIILPIRDCDYLGQRIDGYYRDIEQGVAFLSNMMALASHSAFEFDSRDYRQAIDTLTKVITKKDRRNSYENAIIFLAPIFHMNIDEYLTFIKHDKEEQDMKARYRMNLWE